MAGRSQLKKKIGGGQLLVSTAVQIAFAYIIDLLIGDPKIIPHPVIYMGKAISKLEVKLRNHFTRLKLAGFLFPILIVGGSYLLTFVILYGLGLIHPWLSWAASVWLISTTIAISGLKGAGLEIFSYLQEGNIDKARSALAMVVGRDTNELDEQEIARGAIETVAENIVDAIISPLFFALIGGAPLAIAYRAANTLDSMVGYKNEQYKDLGFASARFDDWLNYIPARITAVFIVISAIIMKLPVNRTIKIIMRDAKLHPSPNSGLPEAAVAGALGIQLGGTNFYGGVPSHRAKMGDPMTKIAAIHIKQTIQLMAVTTFLFIVVILLIGIMR